MTDNEKLERLRCGFAKLPEECKQYVLAVSEALLFASDTLSNGNDKTANKNNDGGKHK
jgi:hypothetical protein